MAERRDAPAIFGRGKVWRPFCLKLCPSGWLGGAGEKTHTKSLYGDAVMTKAAIWDRSSAVGSFTATRAKVIIWVTIGVSRQVIRIVKFCKIKTFCFAEVPSTCYITHACSSSWKGEGWTMVDNVLSVRGSCSNVLVSGNWEVLSGSGEGFRTTDDIFVTN